MRDTRPLLLQTDFPSLRRASLDTLQVNLGYLCNLSCVHCHVNAGPSRTELMSREVIDTLLEFLAQHDIGTLDLTGGAPEMNPHFCYFVESARAMGVRVIDRCNLTVLLEPGFEEMAEFLARQQVVITASLPCYLEENVSAQRGDGVYQDSVAVLKMLNGLGYGLGAELELNLVYNPIGAVLPPSQLQLEADYKRELGERFGITFDSLHTITNMPISRFGAVLLAQNSFDSYMSLLKNNYSAENLPTLMCRSLLSVDWQGYVYDCDFNQMLDMPLKRGDLLASDTRQWHISELMNTRVEGWPIETGEHCYGCAAGQGSSCGGALDVA
ncbi:MAG: arsenosugar biosynthesis radical SAM (seleno)protein ArsS [Pseudomonadales bacterium]